MIFSPNKQFLSFTNKQKLDKKINRFSDLPTLIFFGMLAVTRVFFFSSLTHFLRFQYTELTPVCHSSEQTFTLNVRQFSLTSING